MNPASRFESQIVVKDETPDTESSASHTESEFLLRKAKSIVSTNQSPDVPFEQSVNPYSGCEHGCIYCYARPSHNYWEMSAGLDFERKIVVKENAVELLRQTLSNNDYQCTPIALAGNTDVYQPAEKRYLLTRKILELLEQTNHPAVVITKSSLVCRDIDILQRMAQKQLVSVAVSVTSLDAGLSKVLEPRASSPKARLSAIEQLTAAGIPVNLLVAPIIPQINDSELEQIIEQVAKRGATTASYMFLRLPFEVKDLFKEWLETNFPQRAEHVLSLVKQSRGGKLYDSRHGFRMKAEGVFAEMIKQRFNLAMNKFGMRHRDSKITLDRTKFQAPVKELKKSPQLALF